MSGSPPQSRRAFGCPMRVDMPAARRMLEIMLVAPLLRARSLGAAREPSGECLPVPKVGRQSACVERDGWRLVRTRGSHRQFHHPTKPGTVTIAGRMSKDLSPDTWASILKQAGLKRKHVMTYTVIIEKTGNGYSAYVPDLPGCVAAGDTREETEALISEAVTYHLELLRESGDPVPEPEAIAALVTV